MHRDYSNYEWLVVISLLFGTGLKTVGSSHTPIGAAPFANPLNKILSAASRINVVEEDPNLDIGPLAEISATNGGSASLLCTAHPSVSAITPKLVLWYRSNASRPFMSFDMRLAEHNDIIEALDASNSSRDDFRMQLSEGGKLLVIKNVRHKDRGEYRCVMHFPTYPSTTRRLMLNIIDIPEKVQLRDPEGRPVGSHVGPFSDGESLNVLCWISYSCHLVDIRWMINEKPITSNWSIQGDGKAKSEAQIKLGNQHLHSTLTCRLVCQAANTAQFVDASTVILMYYIPIATLIADGIKSEANHSDSDLHSREGRKVTFLCAVKARPQPYRIVWLHNGMKVSARQNRLSKNNTTLTIVAVTKYDAGLYTCVASNDQGDGSSNAINVKVAHSPYCKEGEQNLVAVRKTAIKLDCHFEAEPQNITFTWQFDPPRKVPEQMSHSPKLQTYNFQSAEELNETNSNDHISFYNSSKTEVDKDDTTRAFLTFVPQNDIQGVVCSANNQLGRTRSPCIFKIKVVDRPSAPTKCSAMQNSEDFFEVTCLPEGQSDYGVPSPGLSYVMSPEVKTMSHLEIWTDSNLLANLTEKQSHWKVRGVPPGEEISMKIYKSSQYARSAVVEMKTKIVRRSRISLSETRSTNSPRADPKDFEVDGGIFQSLEFWSIVAMTGSCCGLFSLLVVSVYFVRKRWKARREENIPINNDNNSFTSQSVLGIKDWNERASEPSMSQQESITKL